MILQRRFAYIGNEIASLLLERGVSEFCAFVMVRESYEFIRNQTSVPYNTILLDEDIHRDYHTEVIDWDFLNSLEKDYGIPNLWPYLENDRIIRYGQLVREYPHNTPSYTHEEMLQILQVTAKRVLAFLEKEKPDFLVYSVVGGVGGMLLYHIAKKMGIRVLVILTTRIGIRHAVSEHYSLLTDLNENGSVSSQSIQKAREFLSTFREKPTPYSDIDSLQLKNPSRARHFKFLSPLRITKTFLFQVQSWLKYFTNEHTDDYSTITPWHQFIDTCKRKTRVLIGFDDLYDPVVAGEKYAFYPLQLEPEISTALYAPLYTDQLWVAKQIAKSLPVGYKLYIKEHLAMFGYRTRKFYAELKKIPNVRLINPYTISYPLIRDAALITTISSTVGWEAVLLKKPVVTFGDVFFNQFPAVQQSPSMADLPLTIRKQIETFVHDEEALVRFLAAIIDCSVDLNLSDIWEKERSTRVHERRDELAPLADLILSRV